jgi:hypothetical protein
VLLTILYGDQTWSLTGKNTKMLEVCQHKMERNILGMTIKNKVRNTYVRKMTSMRNADE